MRRLYEYEDLFYVKTKKLLAIYYEYIFVELMHIHLNFSSKSLLIHESRTVLKTTGIKNSI